MHIRITTLAATIVTLLMPVQALAAPQPTVRWVSKPPTTTAPGSAFFVTVIVRNEANAPSRAKRLVLRASRDGRAGSGDWKIAEIGVRALAPGDARRIRVRTQLPRSMRSQRAFIIGCIERSCAVSSARTNVIRPSLSVTAFPPSPEGVGASFSGTGLAPLTYTCSLNANTPTPCATPSVNYGTGVGSHTIQVRMRDGAGNVVVKSVSVVAVLNAALSASSNNINFGSVEPGNQSSPVNVTITNIGGISTGQLTTTATGFVQFFAVGPDTCHGTSLSPGASCTVTMQFAPPMSGEVDMNVSVSDGVHAHASINASGSAPFV